MMRSKFLLPHVVTLLAAVTAGGAAPGGSWPQWRGPTRDSVSVETGLLKQWPAEGPSLAWKITGLGGGYSGVSVADGRIFTMGDGADSSYVRALGESDGKLLWSTRVGRPGGGGGYPGPRCTPAVDGTLVYASGQYGDVVCVEASDGREVWRKNLATDFGGKVGGWSYSDSPLVDGERVICTPGGPQGALLALNKKTGEVLWRCVDFKDRADYSSVIVAVIGGVRQYIQLTQDSLTGVAADDGRLLWQATRKGRTAVVPTPIYHDNHVYVTSGYGVGCNLFEVTAQGGRFQATQVYENRVMVNHHGGVVRLGDHLYGYSDGGGWVCQDFKSGKEVWANKSLGKGSVVYADGHLYLRDESRGTVALVEASPDGYKEKSRFDQPDRSKQRSWPHPVIAGGKLYLRDQDALFCYDVKQK